MKITINMPEEFEEHYNNDKIVESFERIITDIKQEHFSCSGLYELELIQMLRDEFNSAIEAKEAIEVNEWHNLKKNPNDLPTDTSALYSVLVYSWDFGLSHLYSKYGYYIPTVCEWNGEYFKALNRAAYTNARDIGSCLSWKKIVLPKE